MFQSRHGCSIKEIAMQELIWREPRVKKESGLSKSTRWRMEKEGKFPKKIQLSSRAVGWRAEEIIQWCEDRSEAKSEPVGKHKGEAGRVDTEAR
jgi:prophage regulatory protein